jgi:hypothetical protein
MPSVCAEVESRIRVDAQTMAPGPLRRKFRALILAVDAEEAARRAAAAKADRNVAFRPIEDSQALLIAKGPALQIRALDLQLDADARALIADGDPRTMDQLRFDLLCAHRNDAVNAKPLQALIHVPVATAGPADGRPRLTTTGPADHGGQLDHRRPDSRTAARPVRGPRPRRAIPRRALRRPGLLATRIAMRARPPRQAQRLDRHLRPGRHQPLDEPHRPHLHGPLP